MRRPRGWTAVEGLARLLGWGSAVDARGQHEKGNKSESDAIRALVPWGHVGPPSRRESGRWWPHTKGAPWMQYSSVSGASFTTAPTACHPLKRPPGWPRMGQRLGGANVMSVSLGYDPRKWRTGASIRPLSMMEAIPRQHHGHLGRGVGGTAPTAIAAPHTTLLQCLGRGVPLIVFGVGNHRSLSASARSSLSPPPLPPLGHLCRRRRRLLHRHAPHRGARWKRMSRKSPLPSPPAASVSDQVSPPPSGANWAVTEMAARNPSKGPNGDSRRLV